MIYEFVHQSFFSSMGGAVLLRHEPRRLIVVIIKWGKHKHDEYSVDRGSGMADLKLQTAQRVVSNRCLL